jgi:hypothetical protein
VHVVGAVAAGRQEGAPVEHEGAPGVAPGKVTWTGAHRSGGSTARWCARTSERRSNGEVVRGGRR